tara:strand:- start:256 stop:2004 length:1749 start_codon:yes stop_codon:yes gene_type:complete
MEIFFTILNDIKSIDHLSPFLAIGILILAGFFGGWVAKLVKLPHVTGNILGGVLIGPWGLKLLSEHDVYSLAPLSTFAMSLVAVSIGGHLSYRRIHNSIRRILSISFFEIFFSVLFVMTAVKALGADWPTTCLLGAISASTAPATSIALIRELRAKGPFVKTLISAVALNNILCITLFVMMSTFVSAFYETGEAIQKIDEALIKTLYQFLGALALGWLMGWISKILVSKPQLHDFTIILLAILLLNGLADYLTLSPLLVNLFYGVYLANSSHVAERQLTTLVPLEPILYVCFFTLAGVSLHLDAIAIVGLMAVIYTFSRIIGKTVGTWIGGLIGKCSTRIRTHMTYALYPQSGIAIGLVVLLSNDIWITDHIKETVSAIVLAGVAIAEMIGPICTKAAVKSAKEDQKDRERIVEFLSEEFIKVDLKANDKWDAIKQLTNFMIRTHKVEHMTENELYESIIAREKDMTTAIGDGIAIPHGYIPKGPSIQGVMGICREGIDFEASDNQKIRLILLIITPEDKRDMHLKVLSSLSRMMSNKIIRNRLLSAISPEDAMEIIESEDARDYNYFLEDSGLTPKITVDN